MGMFNWTTSRGDGSSVSPDFWVYWAVTIPMTVITLAGWAVWWKFEKYRFERAMRLGTQDAGPRPLARGMVGEVKLPWASAY